MRPPCDEAVIRSGAVAVPCAAATKRWILAATIIGSSMAFIDSTVVNVALPALQTSFHATVVGVQWVVESYGLFLGALILVGGSLGDLFGRRLVFVLGVATFALASAGCGFASNLYQLIVARSIQGVGAALLVPGSLAIISTSFDEKSRGQAIGTWSGFTAITTAIGPVLGGWLVQHASWRWVFFINPPLAATVIAISLWHVPESRNATGGHVDWLGALVVTLGLGGLVSGFIESVSLGWRNPLVVASLIVGCACLMFLLLVEARVASPMVPLSLFSSSSFSGTNLLTLFLYAAIGIFFFLFPLNLIQVQGYSATATGAALLPFIFLIFFLSRWSGGLVTRYGSKASVDRRSTRGRVGICSVCRALCRRQLLEDVFPCGDCSWSGYGDYRGSPHYGRHEFSGPGPCGSSFWNQQRRCARCWGACDCSPRDCDGERLCFSPESQPGPGPAAARRPPGGAVERNQAGWLARAHWPQSRCQSCRQGIDCGSICIWISSRDVDLRRPVCSGFCGGMAHDSERHDASFIGSRRR
jgi:MFS family permease